MLILECPKRSWTFFAGSPRPPAQLGQRFFAETSAFEAAELTTDEELNALREATWAATEKSMVGVPVRNDEDALAAVDWLTNLGKGCMIGLDDSVAGSLMLELRSYLARKVQS
jgi:hypothetical protein